MNPSDGSRNQLIRKSNASYPGRLIGDAAVALARPVLLPPPLLLFLSRSRRYDDEIWQDLLSILQSGTTNKSACSEHVSLINQPSRLSTKTERAPHLLCPPSRFKCGVAQRSPIPFLYFLSVCCRGPNSSRTSLFDAARSVLTSPLSLAFFYLKSLPFPSSLNLFWQVLVCHKHNWIFRVLI